MRDFKIFHLRIWFTLVLFASAQFSNAGRVQIRNPDREFAYTVTLHSLSVNEPNQDHHLIQRSLPKRTILGVHRDQATFSFYEWGAPRTFFTFRQTHVEVEIFHTASMILHAKDEKQDVWHFRCVFTADKDTMDTLYTYLSVNTGYGVMTYKMNIKNVEEYVKMDHMREPSVRKVDDLQPATLYDQLIAQENSPGKIFHITTYTLVRHQRKFTRLMFRTGSFRCGKVGKKVVIELSGFSDCSFIFYFERSSEARNFLRYIDGTGENEALEITSDLRFYLERGSLRTRPQNQSEPQSSSQLDEDELCALTLATLPGKHSRCDKNSSRNVRFRSDDNRE